MPTIGNIDIVFLGTASAQPSPTRNHSSLALRFDGRIWLFDAGEGTQHQIIQSDLKAGKVEKIFVTHLHGDHCFGIPGLLCTLSQAAGGWCPGEDKDMKFEIFGPKGTREYIRNALKSTYSRLGCRYTVHELHFPDDQSTPPSETLHNDEIAGRDIQLTSGSNAAHPNESHWSVLHDPETDMTVTAAPIAHTVPCIGYVIQEPPHPGNINISTLQPHLERNRKALAEQGIKNPSILIGKLMSQQSLTLPDGTNLLLKEHLTPPTPGRKITILGDTNDPSPIIHLAIDSDLLIHEATNACLKADLASGQTPSSVQESTISHGHSTPEMAGAFARLVGARKLVLNHFSSRYKGDLSEESLQIMEEIRALAVGTFMNEDVICARDFLSVEIVRRRADGG
ncbi:ribonuclease Z [Spizellomyces punctatus DAOM BR117]|uniref:Ribonuclease Z n=1 Tax=Spizellomyces punctatus (strain DAOM BR117) TaxID=645134 RepID=A0A0L0HDL4_SPIPD|nr:ribonuclease Z [Spizellomyces punctatus DAOM BR117]KNC99081.1 ribonuclease Z [Spizellomyces punctatus DAOM BR117]|eukprot:XP_016607121.1 ribonuclease Z [Spizellomyces punctatus DAOM BR117]